MNQIEVAVTSSAAAVCTSNFCLFNFLIRAKIFTMMKMITTRARVDNVRCHLSHISLSIEVIFLFAGSGDANCGPITNINETAMMGKFFFRTDVV